MELKIGKVVEHAMGGKKFGDKTFMGYVCKFEIYEVGNL